MAAVDKLMPSGGALKAQLTEETLLDSTLHHILNV